jgi:hypothetical protein
VKQNRQARILACQIGGFDYIGRKKRHWQTAFFKGGTKRADNPPVE